MPPKLLALAKPSLRGKSCFAALSNSRAAMHVHNFTATTAADVDVVAHGSVVCGFVFGTMHANRDWKQPPSNMPQSNLGGIFIGCEEP